jgi:hypothetical protein
MEARMNIGKFVLLTATLMLAMALTLSCSSGDDDESGGSGGGGSGGVDMSGLPTQLYLDDEEYKGNSDIKLFAGKWDDDELFSDTLSVGKIQNGKITLALPENMDKYLIKFDLPPNVSYPNDLFFFFEEHTFAIINGERYQLKLRAEEEVELCFMYFSKSGKINGSFDDYGSIKAFNMNISKGWNVVWWTEEELGDLPPHYDNSLSLFSTSRPQAIGELKWVAEREEAEIYSVP